MWNSVLTTKLSLTGYSSAARQCWTSFWDVDCSFFCFFCFCFLGGGDKFVEIAESCFSRQKCNCCRLCATVWIFVGIERESGTPAADHLAKTLFVIIKVCILCSPSLMCVSYPSPQSSVNAEGTSSISAVKDSRTKPSVLWCTNVSTNTNKATWKHVNFHFRP